MASHQSNPHEQPGDKKPPAQQGTPTPMRHDEDDGDETGKGADSRNSDNPGSFANDPKRAREAGKQSGKQGGKS